MCGTCYHSQCVSATHQQQLKLERSDESASAKDLWTRNRCTAYKNKIQDLSLSISHVVVKIFVNQAEVTKQKLQVKEEVT